MVWVEGEPGIGKSCLVSEALAAANQPGFDVAWGIAGVQGGLASSEAVATNLLTVRVDLDSP